jgi:single-strand DNA-binding protein
MAGEPYITVIGNMAGDPELRFTSSGHAVASFTIAQTPRSYDKATQQHVDDETLWVRCTVWREAAENVAETLTKGMRVVAHGRLNARSFETKSGEQRTNWELTVDEIGPSLRWATAQVNRTPKQGGQSAVPPATGGGWNTPANDPWGGGGQQQSSAPPF